MNQDRSRSRIPHDGASTSGAQSSRRGMRRATACGALLGLSTLLAGSSHGQSTQLVSILGAIQADNDSFTCGIAPNGRFVAFTSRASNFVSPDILGFTDVFIADTTNGGVNGITRISELAGTEAAEDSEITTDCMSADGRYVVFSSRAGNLASGDGNATWDVFVRDRLDTTPAGLVLLSRATNGLSGSGASRSAVISSDGTWIAFASDAKNLVAGDSNLARDAFRVLNPLLGAGAISALTDVTTGSGISDMVIAGTSASGNLVSITTRRALLASDTNGFVDVYLHDVAAGTDTLASLPNVFAQANGDSAGGSLSANGQFIAFSSDATNLAGTDTNGKADVFLRDLSSGTNTRMDGLGGMQANDDPLGVPCISPDGLRVAFGSWANNFVVGDLNATPDVFVYDRISLGVYRASVSTAGVEGNHRSVGPAISSTDVVAFVSGASNLVAGDTNFHIDIFTRDMLMLTGTTVCDGASLGSICPCAAGAIGHGCPNSVYAQGALLQAQGNPSVSNDSLRLVGNYMPGATSVIFVQCSQLVAPLVFGDGQWCAGGTLNRLGSRTTVNGLASLGYDNPGDPQIHVRGQIPASGGTYYYFLDYRNAVNFCDPLETKNASNGVAITWIP